VPRIRVVIADDHALLREGLRALLKTAEDIEVVGEAADGLEAIEVCRKLGPDIVLMDIAMPGLGGLEAALEVRKVSPHTRVLVLTQYDDREYVSRFLKAGAAGYILKKAAGTELVSAIRGVSRGGLVLDPAIARDPGLAAARNSVVRVRGFACGLGIEGSGWVAGRGLVVTSAHVVAGVDAPRVDRNDGDLLAARVVAFDKTNDVAVLRVPGLAARPLPLADATEGTPGGLLGYPGNGPYTETAVRVGRDVQIVGRYAYGHFPTTRRGATNLRRIRSRNPGVPG